MTITAVEHARQAGYDDGYEDGREVGAIDALGPDVASYRRPQWMSAETWQRVSADLTEQWLTLLEREARALTGAR